MSRILGAFRWAFVPLGLFAVVAVGVHAAADVIDESILRLVERIDVFFDAFFSAHEWTAAWVDAIDARERIALARGLAFTWEVAVDAFIALPKLGFDDQVLPVRELLARLNRQPTPMRLLRPLLAATFVVAGAVQVSKLVESTLFVGLVGDVAPAEVAAWLSRVAGGSALLVVLVSCGWRAVLRSLQHADDVCRTSARPWLSGLLGTALALPLAAALVFSALDGWWAPGRAEARLAQRTPGSSR